MRVLVTAASRHDSTRGIAKAIEDGLARRGVDAQERPVEEVGSLAGFGAVVLGSAVYTGRWMRPAIAFAHSNADELAAMPVWLFSSGPLGGPEQPVPQTEPADVDELLLITGAREHRTFGGRLERERLGVVERAMVRAVRAPYGDDRDWAAVDCLAAEIAAALQAHAGELMTSTSVLSGRRGLADRRSARSERTR